MNDLHKKFIEEKFDANGILTAFKTIVPKSFNFAFDVMDKLAKTDPDGRAYLYVNEHGENITVTFGEFKTLMDKTANFFVSAGIKKGDAVMLVLKKHKEYWQSLLALCKIGAVAVPATALLTEKDFVYRFEACDCKHIVCTADGITAESVDKAAKGYKGLKNKIIVRGQRAGWIDFEKGVQDAPSKLLRPTGDAATKNDDIMFIYFTSGTTGYPKMTKHNFTYPIAHIYTAKHWHNIEPKGLHTTMSDSGWAKSSWGNLYGQWFLGAGLFIYDFDKFSAADLLENLAKYRITTFCAPPTVFRFMIKEDLAKYDLSSIKYCTIAGEALNPEVYEKFLESTGIRLMEGFGQTETTLLAANTTNMLPKPGSMGKPSVQYDVQILDEGCKPVEDGVTGEICVKYDFNKKQAGLFDGYHRSEDTTKSAVYGGFYHTGDTAWRDEDGYIWFVGRKDDIIKSSGYRIGPFEVESVIMEHKSVLECAVIGVPDETRGQAVKAFIVPTKGVAPSDALKKEIQDYCKSHTAPYKYPRVIEFVAELPKTISGKIKRTELREGIIE